MSTASSIKKGTDASGTAVATHSITENAETRHVQRVSITDPDGNDLTAQAADVAPSAPAAVTASATLIAASSATRRGILLYNAGPNDCFIGFTNGVTTSNGIKIYSGGAFQLQGIGIYRGAIYGICASSETADVRIQSW